MRVLEGRSIDFPASAPCSLPPLQALRTYALQPAGPGMRVQLPPLAPTQQAQQEGAPDEGSCAQEEGPAAAGAADAAGAAAVQQQASQHVAAAQAAAEQRGAGEPETAAAAAAAAGAPEAAAAGAPEAEKPVLLRMEPLEGCLTTCEAGMTGCCASAPMLICPLFTILMLGGMASARVLCLPLRLGPAPSHAACCHRCNSCPARVPLLCLGVGAQALQLFSSFPVRPLPCVQWRGRSVRWRGLGGRL